MCLAHNDNKALVIALRFGTEVCFSNVKQICTTTFRGLDCGQSGPNSILIRKGCQKGNKMARLSD